MARKFQPNAERRKQPAACCSYSSARLQQLRKQIAEGTYLTGSKLEAVVDGLLEDAHRQRPRHRAAS